MKFKKETPLQVFSCEFCEIFKNSLFDRSPPVVASVNRKLYQKLSTTIKVKNQKPNLKISLDIKIKIKNQKTIKLN